MHLTAPVVLALLVLPLAHAQAGRYDILPAVPRFTLAGEYNYIRANAPPSGCECFSLNGASVQGGLTLRYWLRAVADVGYSRTSSIGTLGQDLTLTTYMGGPQIVLHGRRVETFAHALVGGAHGADSYFPTGTSYTTSASSFAYKLGGGFDYSLNHFLAVRIIEVNYLHTGFPNAANNSQNHLVIGTGIVLHLRNSAWAPDSGPGRRDGKRAMREMHTPRPGAHLQPAASSA
jgi:peptidoglycan-associated lipoprotein